MQSMTIEELKALPNGDWVWVVYQKPAGIDSFYARSKGYWEGDIRFIHDCAGCYLDLDTYGEVWVAYKNKELAELSETGLSPELQAQALEWTCFFKDAYIRQLEEELAEARENQFNLPCKIGTPLFELIQIYRSKAEPEWFMNIGHCSMLQQKADGSWKIRFSRDNGYGGGHDVTLDKFGDTMFTSEVEAQKRLRELENE